MVQSYRTPIKSELLTQLLFARLGKTGKLFGRGEEKCQQTISAGCVWRACDRTQRAFGKFLSISCHMLSNNSTAVGCIHCYIGDMWHVISAGARCGLIQLVSSIDVCFLLGRSWQFTDLFFCFSVYILAETKILGIKNVCLWVEQATLPVI